MSDLGLLLHAILAGGPVEADPDEEEIQKSVRAAREGDSGAASRIYSQYVGRIYRTVRPMCASNAEAEDVTQDTFVRALTKIHSYQPREGKRFVAWLTTIALNLARKKRRRRGEEALDRRGEPATTDDPLGEAVDARRLQRRLLEALDSLSDRDREIIVLRYGAGLDAPEVAIAVGVTAANVRKICERARAKLLAELEPAPEEARP